MLSGRLWRVAIAAAMAVLGAGAQTVPAHADTYTDYLVSQLRHDPVYISSYADSVTPAAAPQLQRLISRLPLRTYVIADVSAGPDGQLTDSDLAAVLHDQLGGGVFIFERGDVISASAVGFGTSLPVSDAMLAATTEFATQLNATFADVLTRFVTILLGGKTEQRLAADERAQEVQLHPGHPLSRETDISAAAGAAAGCGLMLLLLTLRRRKRRQAYRRAGSVLS